MSQSTEHRVTPPRVGIVGAGHIGATAATLFARAGHEVALSNSRGPASLADVVARVAAEAGAADGAAPRVRADTVEGAAAFGDVVLLAVPWAALDALPAPSAVAGKVVVDAMNAFGPGYTPADLGGSTSSEVVAARLPGARLVKAFNTIGWEQLGRDGRPGAPSAARRALFVAGDDAGAKAVVLALVDDVGFAPVDTGGLREGGRLQQPNAPLFGRVLTAADAAELLAAA